MKKAAGILLASLLLTLALNGCRKQPSPVSQAASGAQSATQASAVTPEVMEEDTITGEVTGVTETSISLQTDTLACIFDTDAATVLEGAQQFAAGDTVTITYTGRIEQGAHATRVVLESRMPVVGSFTGKIADRTDTTLTVEDARQSGVMRTFMLHNDTQIEGDLTEGDAAQITYYGDLQECPVAMMVVVTKEDKPPEVQTLKGKVIDVSKISVTLAINSAHNYTFALTNSTQITGAAKKVGVGDQVDVTYEGELTAQPTATVVNVLKVAAAPAPATAEIDGVVTSLAGNGFTVNIGSNQKYFFGSDKTTKWSGVDLNVDCNVHITYTGSLVKNPFAVSVVISEPTPKPAPTPTPTVFTCSGTVSYLAAGGFGASVNGGSYYFNTNQSTQWTGTCALGEQCNVNISYVGSLSSATAVRVEVYPPTPQPDPPQPDPPQPDPPQPDPVVTYLATVYQVRLGGLSVLTDNLETVSLNTSKAKFPKGTPAEGDRVKVTYNTDLQQVTQVDVLSVAQSQKEKEVSAYGTEQALSDEATKSSAVSSIPG